MNVAILAERERQDSLVDRQRVEKIIKDQYDEHGSRLVVLSVGCDQGVGKYTLDYCTKNEVKFAEVRIKFQGNDFPRRFFAQIFKSRNMSLLDVCDLFYVFLGPNPRGLVQEIVGPAKERVGPERVVTYPYEPS